MQIGTTQRIRQNTIRSDEGEITEEHPANYLHKHG